MICGEHVKSMHDKWLSGSPMACASGTDQSLFCKIHLPVGHHTQHPREQSNALPGTDVPRPDRFGAALNVCLVTMANGQVEGRDSSDFDARLASERMDVGGIGLTRYRPSWKSSGEFLGRVEGPRATVHAVTLSQVRDCRDCRDLLHFGARVHPGE